MASELQRIARELVAVFNRIPSIVAELHDTARRLEQHAELVEAMTRGSPDGRQVAMQLAAAAAACKNTADVVQPVQEPAVEWAKRFADGSRVPDGGRGAVGTPRRLGDSSTSAGASSGSGGEGVSGLGGEDAEGSGSESGPGVWVRVNEHMSDRARAYQARVTGYRAGFAYDVRGVRFDGYRDGVLIDAKGPGYAQFTKDGEFLEWFNGDRDLLKQAHEQERVADGVPVEWHVAEPDAARTLRALLGSERIRGVEVKHVE